jgi:long-chain acyl-CoA synthetase
MKRTKRREKHEGGSWLPRLSWFRSLTRTDPSKEGRTSSSPVAIYPADVEAALFEHPKVREAAVVGVPDPRRGETVKTFVVLKEGETATEEEIIAFCRERLAAYKVPRVVEFRADLPKSMIGKVLRRTLREEEVGRT